MNAEQLVQRPDSNRKEILEVKPTNNDSDPDFERTGRSSTHLAKT